MTDLPPPLPVRALVPISVIEAVSLLVPPGFAGGRAVGGPGLSSTLGPLHGVVFVIYAGTVLQARPHLGWGGGRTAVVIVAAVVPLGGAIVAPRVMRATIRPGWRRSGRQT